MKDPSSKVRRIMYCPQCRKSVAWDGNPFRPFCSERCKLTDLGNWASESYVIPAGPGGNPFAGDDDSNETE